MDRINDFFAHSGIKGQKWGVRRWQNPDGTLTPEGRERYKKYAKQLGYDIPGIISPKFNKMASGVKSYVGTKLAAESALELRNTAKGLKALSEASKRDPNFVVDKRKLNWINFMSALNVANIGAQTAAKIAIDKRRRYLIKYADAYGGEKASKIKQHAKDARRAAVVGDVAAIGRTAYKVKSWNEMSKAATIKR